MVRQNPSFPLHKGQHRHLGLLSSAHRGHRAGRGSSILRNGVTTALRRRVSHRPARGPPVKRWRHNEERPSDGFAPTEFEFCWVSLKEIPHLAVGQGRYLQELRQRIGVHSLGCSGVARGGWEYIEPGSPVGERLNRELQRQAERKVAGQGTLPHPQKAQVLTEQHRQTYNHIRPHSSLGYRPPAPVVVPPAEPVLAGPT